MGQFKVKLRRVGNTCVITIPKAMMDGQGLKEEDMLVIEETSYGARIRKDAK